MHLDAQREVIQNNTLFYYRRRVMPHRDLLASTLLCSIGLRHKNSRRALEALESLYSETETVLYRDSLRPLDDVYLYRKSMKEYVTL